MDRRQRALRGVVASALAVFVAALFHVAGGGSEPGAVAMVVSIVLAAPVSVLLAGRRPALWRLALSVGLSQFAFHFLFGLGQPSDIRFAGDTTMAGMPGMRLHVTGGAPAELASSSMWAGHVAAALVTIAAFRHGERLVRRMLALAARFLVTAFALVTAPIAPRPRPVAAALVPPALFPQFLVGTTRHRGPPVRFAFP
ncbi:hypothetical protein [Gryllotalpicola kribbensis]